MFGVYVAWMCISVQAVATNFLVKDNKGSIYLSIYVIVLLSYHLAILQDLPLAG